MFGAGILKKSKKSFSDSMVNALQIPSDLVYKEPVITILGTHEIFIENYKWILEYKNDYLLVQLKNNRIAVEGNDLYISYYTKEEMKVTGRICQISYI